MARAGWQVMFHGGTRCYHHEQRASRKAFSRDAWRHGRAYLRWLMKVGADDAQLGRIDRQPRRRMADDRKTRQGATRHSRSTARRTRAQRGTSGSRSKSVGRLDEPLPARRRLATEHSEVTEEQMQ